MVEYIKRCPHCKRVQIDLAADGITECWYMPPVGCGSCMAKIPKDLPAETCPTCEQALKSVKGDD